MRRNISTRIQLILAKIAGRDVDLSTMTPPVAMNLEEELLLEIADKMDRAASELPSVTKTDEGKILSVNNKGKWVAADETKELPAVSGTDNGNVLTVVEGEWAKAAAPSGGGLSKVARLKLWNKYSTTIAAGGGADVSAWDIVDADQQEWTPIANIPDFDFAIVESVLNAAYDSNGSNIYNLVISNYNLTAPTPEDWDERISFGVRIQNVGSESATSPADSLCGAIITLFKID